MATARRLFEVAELRAASIVSTPSPPQVGSSPEPRVVDLDHIPAAARSAPAEAVVVPTGSDGMLQAAIAEAVDRSSHLGA